MLQSDPDADFLGCYMDSENNPELAFRLEQDTTLESCKSICETNGYKYAGYQGTKCSCGHKVFEMSKLDDTECDSDCSIPNHCGGFWKNSVYELSVTLTECATFYLNNFEISFYKDMVTKY